MLFQFVFWGLLGCGEKNSDSGVDNTSEPVSATLRLLSVVNGQAMSDVTVSSATESSLTDQTGRATVSVDGNSTYQLRATDDASMDHLYQGSAGTDDFEVVGFLVDRSTTNAVFSMMGISQDDSNGIVVAALDNPDLSPAVGASADLENNDESFIFGASGMPTAGNTIVQGGGSFVFFPNVPVGEWTLNTIGTNETTCHAYPSGTDTFAVSVEADRVSVVVFSCF